MKKEVKILSLIVVVILIGVSSYVAYKYYQRQNIGKYFSKTLLEQSLQREIFAEIVKLDGDNLVYKDEGELESIIKLPENLLVKKLEEDKDNPGVYVLVDTNIDELKIEQNVWLIFDDNQRQNLSEIKIMTP